jgi:maleate isomerase
MAVKAPEAAETLAHAGVDALCYACTAGCFFRGPAFEADLARQLAAATGRPVVMMARSIVDAALHLGLGHVVVAAPYEQWVLDLLVTYLEASGLTVLNARGLGHQANALGKYPPEKALELAEQAWRPNADGLIISCGNFRTLEMLDAIEERFGKPVITSNQASAWNLLRASGGFVPQPTGGALLRGIATGTSQHHA